MIFVDEKAIIGLVCTPELALKTQIYSEFVKISLYLIFF